MNRDFFFAVGLAGGRWQVAGGETVNSKMPYVAFVTLLTISASYFVAVTKKQRRNLGYAVHIQCLLKTSGVLL